MRVEAVAFAAGAALLAAGCAWFHHAPDDAHAPVKMRLLAVLPVEPAPAPATGTGPPPAPPSAEGALAVTAQIYRVLAAQTEFRVVPDLTVADIVETPAVRRANSLIDRAVAVGKEVGADGVIVGRLYRYQRRVGTEYGASEAASVWFELQLVAVSSGAVVWHGEFDHTQEPLSSNLLNWWMFWRAGPRWLSASELAGLGVDELFPRMTAAVDTSG